MTLALVLTCRPQWRAWLDHTLAKQEHPYTLIVLRFINFSYKVL